MSPKAVVLIPISGIPLIQPGDDLVKVIIGRLKASHETLRSGDILVITQKIVSKAEGAMMDLKSCCPSRRAKQLAQFCGKDARMIELILRESKKILRLGDGFIITEHKNGWVCANAGIDYSNVQGNYVTLLPQDPDRTAGKIRRKIRVLCGVEVAVVIIDSQGRPFRNGAIGIAIGSSGIPALVHKRGKKDLFNYRLKSTEVALADEIASAAALIMGETNEGIPVVVIHGLKYLGTRGKARDLIRPEKIDLFR
jgi:coenzyme F420-0:L-glutamate ligase/coenzyme F420-1:gamma-L-glutamate ligase